MVATVLYRPQCTNFNNVPDAGEGPVHADTAESVRNLTLRRRENVRQNRRHFPSPGEYLGVCHT